MGPQLFWVWLLTDYRFLTMRIIHVIPSLAIGGAEKLCIDICNTLFSSEKHPYSHFVHSH